MEDLEQALEIIEGDEELADFAGPRDAAHVSAAEKALGLAFPPTYREFLLRLGAGSYGAAEIYGVVDDAFEGPVPDGVWLTLDERERGLPRNFVIVAATGDGGWYSLDVRGGGEAPVVAVELGPKALVSEPVADDFGAFLLEQVEAERDAG
jgi:hypothetical protein